ncbi:MAG: glucoamylase family protein, partial [Daejeonella sp.]
QNSDSTLILKPQTPLKKYTSYFLNINSGLQSTKKGSFQNNTTNKFTTVLDSTDKFPLITDDELLTLIQKQTFKYFYDFAHPVSGLARERNSSGDLVTSGGSGFGIMAIITGVHNGFITRDEGSARIKTIVNFLKNTAKSYHGVYPHWLNGNNGNTIAFSANDDGADLVETAYLIQGLLCARQYFDGADATETGLRANINVIWDAVDWNWFRKEAQENVLYWHWSPNKAWAMNVQVRGWNEALIVYALAASSRTHAIPKIVYTNGWAQNGNMKNGNTYYTYQLPLGPSYGGPLFFSHYSFLGINPNDLIDQYGNYQAQVANHTKINYEYCKANPKKQFGYSADCWGLTASDIANGYTASSPTNDVGVIAPTAALSSFPYTPVESMRALKFFYYKLGDKTWGDRGFYDAFSLKDKWFANSTLAIDQGPIIIMIENHRSGLLWNLFMSCPEVKTGMKDLGFQSPYL